MTYKVEITDVCLSLIEKIPDKRIQSIIMDGIEALKTSHVCFSLFAMLVALCSLRITR